ncbi:MAG: hypothetical protein LWW86_09255 [Micrococcales bacterium]|nr:hypothetical protein [Micrococcales bacterium]
MKSQVQASIALGAVAAVVIGWALAPTSLASGVAIGGVGLLLVAAYGAWSLRRGRHTPWSSAQEQIRPGRAVVLWKPGCPFCELLLRALKDDERITWVNVWRDDAAQARVCELNDGNEYVPTALVGDRVLRNPSADELTHALR